MSAHLALTILVDNAPGSGLEGEHGLSIHLQGSGWAALLDAGQSDLVARNAEALGVDLGRVDDVILSHGHADHTGGLAAVLQRAPSARLHAHPEAGRRRYSVRDAARMIGAPEPARAALQRSLPTRGPTRINAHLHVTGAAPRINAWEGVGGPFYLDAAATQPDDLVDDQALWFEAVGGLVVVLGCAHSGIINATRACQRISGITRVEAIIGGAHLVDADEARVARTLEALREIAPRRLCLCHCTGGRAMAALTAAFPGAVEPCQVGSKLEFALPT